MCGSMVDIQSPTAEIRRGKKIDRRKKKETTVKTIMSVSATQGGHKNRDAQKKRSSHKVCGVSLRTEESLCDKDL